MSQSRGDAGVKGWRIRNGLIGYAAAFFVILLFYNNVILSGVLGAAGAVAMIVYQNKRRIEKEKWQLTMQFKDAMDSMISALTAGYSMENAITESYRDLSMMYAADTRILRELWDMKQKISMHEPLDRILLDFASRSGVEDIHTFAQVYVTARRSGGNLVKIMKRTADNIGEKMEIQREIETMIAGKKMESICMMVIPLFIIVYLRVFSPGFLDPVYQGAAGRLFMTGALFVYVISVIWSRAIMNINC